MRSAIGNEQICLAPYAVVTFTLTMNNTDNNSIQFRLIEVDDIKLAVPEDQITTIVDWTEPTPLPFGPQAILGVVCVHGRMFTVLNLIKLLQPETDTGTTARLILALRGDEQLALAVDKTQMIEVPAKNIKPADEDLTDLLREAFTHEGNDWQVLSVDELFNTLIQGQRRRRRT